MTDDRFHPCDDRWLETVLLAHENPPPPQSDHFDWMLVNPDDPGGLLWTARVLTPIEQWSDGQPFELVEIHPHRRMYLDYQGTIPPLPDQADLPRGSVRRIDRGTFRPLVWQPDRRRLELRMAKASGQMEMTRHQDALWQGRLLGRGADAR